MKSQLIICLLQRKFHIVLTSDIIKMSFFGKLFGKASDKDPVSTGEAIQKLRETEEMLMKKQVGLDKKYVKLY